MKPILWFGLTMLGVVALLYSALPKDLGLPQIPWLTCKACAIVTAAFAVLWAISLVVKKAKEPEKDYSLHLT